MIFIPSFFLFTIFPSCRTLRYMGVKWCCRALELHQAKQQKLHKVHDRHTKPQHLRTYYCKAFKEGTIVSFALVRRAARAHQSAHNRMPAPDHIRQVTRNIMHTARTCGLQCGVCVVRCTPQSRAIKKKTAETWLRTFVISKEHLHKDYKKTVGTVRQKHARKQRDGFKYTLIPTWWNNKAFW